MWFSRSLKYDRSNHAAGLILTSKEKRSLCLRIAQIRTPSLTPALEWENTDRFSSSRALILFFPRFERPLIMIFTTCFCQSLFTIVKIVIRVLSNRGKNGFEALEELKRSVLSDFYDRISLIFKIGSINPL